MRPLKKALQDHELIVLRIIGEWWEIELTGQKKTKCVSILAAEMPNLDIPQELMYLSTNESDAIKALVRANGRLPKATFSREFGEVRQMGPGALEREEPWMEPQSPAEDLWYRGLIFAGFDRDDPTVEYIYLPDEFFSMFDPATLDQELEPGEGGADEADDPIVQVEGPEDNEYEDVPPPTALKKKKTSLKGVGRSLPEGLLSGVLDSMGGSDEKPSPPKKEAAKPEPEKKAKPAAKAKKKPIKIKPPKKKVELSAEEEAEAYVDIDNEIAPEYDDGSSKGPDEEESGVPRQSIEERPMEPEPAWATEKLPEDKNVIEAAVKPAKKPKQNSRLNKKGLPEKEPEGWQPAVTDAVDDFVTLLTLAQTGQLQNGQTERIKPYLLDRDENRLNMLLAIGISLAYFKRVEGGYRPTKAAVSWLQNGREAQMRQLAMGWLDCAWNELRHVPTLRCEGSNWSNDPIVARKVLLDGLTLDLDWRAYTAVAQRVKKEKPDFQRPNGNYDVWYIRDLATGEYVSGFENWDLVEGRLLRYLIENPLNWLGMSEVGHEKFRLTERAVAWINEGETVESEQSESLVLTGNGLLQLTTSVDRYKRFQAGRFAQLQPQSEPDGATGSKIFSYRVTPGSLQRAKDVGIDSGRVLQFLQQASADGVIPAGLKRAIQRWSENNTEAMVEQTVILRVNDPKIMDTLRNRPETRPYLAESLSDTVVIVMPGSWGELCQAAAQLGLLLEPIGLG